MSFTHKLVLKPFANREANQGLMYFAGANMNFLNTARTFAAIFTLITASILFVMMVGLNLEARTLLYILKGSFLLVVGDLNDTRDASILILLVAFYSVGIYLKWVAQEAFKFLTDPRNC